MKKLGFFLAAMGLLIILIPALVRGGGEDATAQELSREAYRLDREGRKAIYEEDLTGAYQAFTAAVEVYAEISRLHPEWRTDSIQARMAALKAEAETIGRQIFSLPEGLVEIRPGMTREGKRYDDGRSLAGKVKAAGDEEYEVEVFTVSLVRQGPLLGASCTCPDFNYRGKKHGFACKHIWAVIARENLLR